MSDFYDIGYHEETKITLTFAVDDFTLMQIIAAKKGMTLSHWFRTMIYQEFRKMHEDDNE